MRAAQLLDEVTKPVTAKTFRRWKRVNSRLFAYYNEMRKLEDELAPMIHLMWTREAPELWCEIVRNRNDINTIQDLIRSSVRVRFRPESGYGAFEVELSYNGDGSSLGEDADTYSHFVYLMWTDFLKKFLPRIVTNAVIGYKVVSIKPGEPNKFSQCIVTAVKLRPV